MGAIKLEHKGNKLLISVDKDQIDTDFVVKLVERMRLEYLAKKVDFDEGIEELGKQIKGTWWENNKHKFPEEEL